MKTQKLLKITLGLVTVLTGCTPNKVNLVYLPDEHKVVLHPDNGTLLTWKDPAGQPVTVTFPFGNPCKPDNAAGQCTINVPNARVPYTCPNCADPEIVVGTDISTGQIPADRDTATAPTATVFMGCNSNHVSIYPSTVSIPKATVAAGATILWVPGGLTPVGSDWKADSFSASICTNSPPFNHGNAMCTLKTDLAAGSTTYAVSAASCNNTSAPGTITITP
ncbi:MAG TPA: hypothetical protein VG456_27400 [Candidatus Sulfopaludibacter sp.]|jgi:hypothetical protein|nr:hypothetical protein [Candidatus Sulfopaludibacter sp.]